MQRTFAQALALGGAAAALALGGCGGKPLSGTIAGVQTPASQRLVSAWSARFASDMGAHVRARVGAAAAFATGRAAFALTDEPRDPPAGGKGQPVAIPIAISPVAIAYNVTTFQGKRFPAGVWLDGISLAAIYEGAKFNWAQNRFIIRNNRRFGIRLPDELFQVCRDPGPSAINTTFTTYLSRAWPKWSHGPGIGARVRWPRIEDPATDTADVAGCVKRNAGAIGYAPLALARQRGLTVASLEGPSGRGPYYPPEDPRYPIQAPTYALVWRDMCRAGLSEKDAGNVRAWLDFALGARGQAMTARYGYRPLPASARASARAQVAALRCDGRAISVPRA